MVCVPLRVKAVVKFVHKVLAEHVGRAITLVQLRYDWMVFRSIPPLIEIGIGEGSGQKPAKEKDEKRAESTL